MTLSPTREHVMRASIIVCAYNRVAQLPSCLHSLVTQGVDEVEVIVVDDGSTDDTPRLLAEWSAKHPALVVVTNPGNLGLSAARNAGLAVARGEFVIFTDSDCTAESGWLAQLLAAFAAPTVVAAAGVSIDHPPRTYAEKAYTGTTLIGMAAVQGRRLVGNNMAFRRSILDQYGFDPAMSYYCDEDELAWRLTSDGHLIAFAPHAVVRHDHPMTTRKYLRLAWLQGQGSARLWYKQGRVVGRDLLPATLAMLTLPLGFVSVWMLTIPSVFAASQLAALVYNQFSLKGKTLGTALAVLPLEAVYLACKAVSVVRTRLRIACGFEPVIRESKRRWWTRTVRTGETVSP